MSNSLKLQDVLNLAGLGGFTIHLVRHSLQGDIDVASELLKSKDTHDSRGRAKKWFIDTRISPLSAEAKLRNLRANPSLLKGYTSHQVSGKFKKDEIVLAFASTGGQSAEYLCAYRVGASLQGFDAIKGIQDIVVDMPDILNYGQTKYCWNDLGISYVDEEVPNYTFYEFEPLENRYLNGLQRRMIVSWQGALQFIQYVNDKFVLEIRPEGFVREWTNYDDFVLSFSELRDVVNDSVWKEKLSSVCGVYLITYENYGEVKYYVGSAYGEDGILGRWVGYASGKFNNDNQGLIELPIGWEKTASITMLKDMSKSSKKEAVIAVETMYKEKLLSRKYGLNRN